MIKIERTFATLPNGKAQELLALLRERGIEVHEKTLRQQLGRDFPGVPVEIHGCLVALGSESTIIEIA